MRRPRQDRGVRVRRAARRDKAEDKRLVQLHGLARRKVVRCHDARHVGHNAALALTGQNADHPRRNIPNIRRTRLHVAVVHRGEHLCELRTGVADGSLRIQTVVFDEPLNALDEIQIVQHHLVGLEQHGCVLACLSERLVMQYAELLLRGLAGIMKTRELRRGIRHRTARDFAVRAAVKADRPRRYAL